ncbi:MAG: PLP-dependent aminotransferase family protein [Ardenticatenales bacterium]|nr:PLP-dependent aminotransferase family protein [Ardenticatenales bacterium]
MYPQPKLLSAEPKLAEWTTHVKRSVLRDMIAVVSKPGILSFAGGLPAPDLFPCDSFSDAVAHAMSSDALALQYRPPYEPLKAQIVELMRMRGVECSTRQIFITTGAQQALAVLAQMLLDPHGTVAAERIVYTGLQQAVAPMSPRFLSIETDLQSGMDVDQLRRALAGGERPAFLYTVPEAHNPLGVSLSPAKRHQLIAVAREYGLPIIEDDPYGLLSYDGAAPDALRSLDETFVFYLGSFSKIIAPALRVGWIVAPEAMVPKLTVVKEAADLETSALMQRAISAWLAAGHLAPHLALLRREYGARRDAMLAALRRHFPANATWTEPEAGMFVWVELPQAFDTGALFERALAEEQVAFIPGHAFAVGGQGARNCLRLNFSNATVDQINHGIERLGRVIG